VTARRAGKINRETLKLNCELSLMHLKTGHGQEKLGKLGKRVAFVSHCQCQTDGGIPLTGEQCVQIRFPRFSAHFSRGTWARAQEKPRTEHRESRLMQCGQRGLTVWFAYLRFWPRGLHCCLFCLFLPCKTAISDVDSPENNSHSIDKSNYGIFW